jgi:hypothetical protein
MSSKPADRAARRGSSIFGRTTRGIASLLPAPRDVALLELGWALRALLTGRASIPRYARREGWRTPRRLRRAEHELSIDRPARALEEAERVLANEPTNERALRIRVAALARLGDVEPLLPAVRHLREVADDTGLAALERHWVGELVATDPRWTPAIPGSIRPAGLPRMGVVLHLAEETLPHAADDSARRHGTTLRAQRAAGLEPIVVTAPGFPRRLGLTDVPTEEIVDGVVHHRLDLGPGYRLDQPSDVRLSDFAWLAAMVAVSARPSIIWAVPSPPLHEVALVGRALRERFSIPLVLDAGSALADLPTANEEHTHRPREQAARALAEADAIVVSDDPQAIVVAAAGADADRVVVIPTTDAHGVIGATIVDRHRVLCGRLIGAR